MRLIDADALKSYGTSWKTPMDAYRDINLAPTIDSVPIVHGEWKSVHDVIWLCSICHYAHSRSNYCPNCGAKMTIEGSERREDGDE